MMLYTIIDIGSNTVKIAVLDEENFCRSAPVYFKAVPLNLRSKIEQNRLRASAVEELCDLMLQFSQISQKMSPLPPIAFATASLRGLDNTNEVLNAVRQKTGIEVDLISGETEAYYSFLGARESVRAHAGISVDLGGGSTELLSFRNKNVLQSVSLPFGCITLYHRFFDQSYDYNACCRFIRRYLEAEAPPLSGNSILLSGGSAKALLKYKNMLEDKKSFTLGIRQFRRIRWHFRNGDEAVREKISLVLKDRYRLVPPALAVFSQIADFYQMPQVMVCRSGVREGCLIHHLQKKDEKK